MKNYTIKRNNSEVRAEQVTKKYDSIFLGVDLHKVSIRVTRTIDGATPQPAQRFSWTQFELFAQKQLSLAKKVYVCYEAGAFGFWLCRKLRDMGIHCYVVHPEKLDPRHKGVQTDRLDSLHLADKLQRFVRGNEKAMVSVYVPDEQEERKRLEARHRRHLAKELKRLQARGRGLLLSQGFFQATRWWTASLWSKLKPQLWPELQNILEDLRVRIELLEKQLEPVEKKLEASAPKQLPLGFGRLTYALLLRELCNYQRFHSRRNIGGFTGLCGGVSSSGSYHLDLSITKAGSSYIRGLLIELAWRMVYWQPDYKATRRWKRCCGGGLGRVHKRRKKIAIVALARQLAVDIWKWQTGQVQPEELGWKMTAA